jgi:hypothetical protein
MTFRNDLDAAHARIDTLEREKRELAEQNARLNARLGTSPRTSTTVETEPKPWPLMTLFDGISALFRGLFSRR